MPHPDTPLIPELQDYRRRFEAARQDAGALAAPLTPAQLSWRPRPEAWSIAQCLDHLVVTGRSVLPKLDESIARAHARGWHGQGPFRYGWLGNWFVRANGPTEEPPKRPVPTPGIYMPHADPAAAEVLPAFVALQGELVERLHRANGLDLARAKAASPVTRLLRLSLGQWFALLAGHQERHLRQAGRVRAHPGFPA